MFLYPALTLGFLFVAVPLLVHLINMLRHRRQPWAAMDFLLASYRKQKKWIRLRQLLLLLSRLAVAAILISLLCGWTGGGQMLGVLGGRTTHHVVILDDSYSMGDESLGPSVRRAATADPSSSGTAGNSFTAYGRSLQALQDLTRRLANSDGNHQLTVMRSSRAAMATRGGSESGDAAADLSAQTITSDARLINRVMATMASPIRTDLVPALDLATELINTTPADDKFLYIASDFRERDWGSPERLAESLRQASTDVAIRMIDCAAQPSPNLAITDVSPAPDVWVAGVPVVISVTVRNYSQTLAQNVPITSRVIRYSDALQLADPTLAFSGDVESLPALVIESLPAGAEITKSFQVFVTETGTHAIEVSLPDDALPIDNIRSCTLPLSDVEKVLVIDGDNDARGAYHIASVLNPGSQVRIGAVPDIQPPSFLRSATLETLSPYRAIYLIDVPEIGENAADALSQYVERGGGLAWFLGTEVSKDSYNSSLMAQDRNLLPALLEESKELTRSEDAAAGDVQFGEKSPLLAPLSAAGDAAFSLVGVSRSWQLETPALNDVDQGDQPRVRNVLLRSDGLPLVTQHDVGRGRIVTAMIGLDGAWTNWPGDPTFVVFMLQTNAFLWSGAAPETHRFVDSELLRRLPVDAYTGQASYLPANNEPPRIPVEMEAVRIEPESAADEPYFLIGADPNELVIEGEENVAEILHPGISEWSLTRADGSGQVVPVASIIRVGEGDLSRADPASIQQQLLPLEVKFVSSSVWSEENRTAGSSTLTLLLLGLLGIVLAAEQALAYWASYHSSAKSQASHATPSLGGQR
ncbi:MAG: BatA domain-containing protein [Rubripirellula sp.]